MGVGDVGESHGESDLEAEGKRRENSSMTVMLAFFSSVVPCKSLLRKFASSDWHPNEHT
jgi:hypothetical protein